MATIFIETNKQTYFPGEQVSGRILISVSATMKNSDGIFLTLKGFEKIKKITMKPFQQSSNNNLNPQGQNLKTSQAMLMNTVQASEGDSQNEIKERLRPRTIKNANNQLFELTYSTQQCQLLKSRLELLPPGKIEAGSYTFPFRLNLDKSLPASTSVNHSETKATIKYELAVTLQPFNARFQFRDTKEILLKQKSNKSQGWAEEVSSLSCLNRGRCNYTVVCDSAQSGSQSQSLISIDNRECQSDVSGFKYALKHKLSLKDSNQSPIQESTLVQKEVQCLIKAGEQADGSKSIRQQINIPQIPPTTSSSLIKSQTILEISLSYNAFFFSSTKNTLPIIITPRETKRKLPNCFAQTSKFKEFPQLQIKPILNQPNPKP